MFVAKFKVVCALVITTLVGSCAQDSAPALKSNECVILLHGLARTTLSMQRMKRTLEKSGYRVANVDYPSRDHTIEVLAPMAIADGLNQCREKSDSVTVHFVTHSLGGILVRVYLADNAIDNLGRVVMLAPPNQGSRAVDEMVRIPGFDWLNGPAGYQLGKGPESVPLRLGVPEFDFAVIAGDRTIDPITSAVLDDPDDGKVSVSDTRLQGMQDFVVVPVSHAMIMQDRAVFRLVKNFLAHGSFDPDPATVHVVMTTSQGDIGIDLYMDRAPLTAANFLKLVEGKHLDGGSFYRVVTYENDNGSPKIEVIQGGLGDEGESPFQPIDHETTEQTGILHTDGVISMARGAVGTASSEFFICLGDQPGLDHGNVRNPDAQGFAAFGKVVIGMDVVRRINQLPADAPTDSAYTQGQILTEPVVIVSVRRAN